MKENKSEVMNDESKEILRLLRVEQNILRMRIKYNTISSIRILASNSRPPSLKDFEKVLTAYNAAEYNY